MDFRLIRHLYYFHTISEERHFGRAAARLGMTQPPLSAQIKVLEQALGVQLLERSRAGVRLSPHGEAIMPAVKRMLDSAENLESIVHLAKAGQSQALVVGAVTSAMFHPLGHGMQVVSEQMPELTVSLVEMGTDKALHAVEREEIDIAFVRSETVSDPLVCRPLVRERLVVAMWPDHPLASSATIAKSALASHGLVMCPRAVSPEYFDAIHSHFRASGLALKAPHTAMSILSQIAMVACRVGLAVVPKSFAEFEKGRVVYRPLDSALEVVTAAAVWNKNRQSAVIETFVETIATSQKSGLGQI